mgnify:CR=1 FL=1
MSSTVNKLLPQWAKPKPVDMMGDYTKAYKIKTRFGMLGPVLCGKSTIAAAIVHTCETLSSVDPNFYCRVLPTSTHILSDANNLRLGHFPEKTDPYLPRAPEAGFLLGRRGWRDSKVQVPICDCAGEITDYIAMKASGFTPSQIIMQRLQSINAEVVATIKDCQGFILAMAADDALIFRDSSSKIDPDVYTHTVMNDILEYRRKNHKSDPQVIVILTKWDKVKERAENIQMDVYDSQDQLDRFLANGFPATSMLLKPLRDKGNVRYFRSWFNIKKNEDGSPMYWPATDPADTKKPVIEVYENENDYIRFKPRFSDLEYKRLVEYIGSFGD